MYWVYMLYHSGKLCDYYMNENNINRSDNCLSHQRYKIRNGFGIGTVTLTYKQTRLHNCGFLRASTNEQGVSRARGSLEAFACERGMTIWGSVANFSSLLNYMPVIVNNRVRWKRMVVDFKGTHFPKSVILHAIFFYVRYPVSYCDLTDHQINDGLQSAPFRISHHSRHRSGPHDPKEPVHKRQPITIQRLCGARSVTTAMISTLLIY